MNLKASTVYRSLQKLLTNGLAIRNMKTIKTGGYFYEYALTPVTTIEKPPPRKKRIMLSTSMTIPFITWSLFLRLLEISNMPYEMIIWINPSTIRHRRNIDNALKDKFYGLLAPIS